MAMAAALAYAATPVAIRAARRFAFYDVPFGYKGHTAPTPYLGGAAVTIAFVAALILGAGDPARTLPLLAGVLVMFALGTVDDRRTVSPLLRVGVEFALGVWLSQLGHGWHLGAGHALDAVVTGMWVVGVVNAFNLFDNMDGAASSITIVAAAGACTLAWIAGNQWAAAGSAALCGACLGFLPHNLARPARIFLGDGGSMPLGFAVAALTASAARTAEPSLLALLTGVLLVGIPALDTTLVIVSRRRRGISILSGGRDHLTHRTRRRMGTARRVALVLGASQALVSGLVVIATRASSATVVYLLLAFVVCAAAVIVALETHATADAESSESLAIASDAGAAVAEPERPVAVALPERLAPPPPELPVDPATRSSWLGRAVLAALGAVGLAAGLSPLFSAYYSPGVWVPLGLLVVVAAAAVAVARPHSIPRPAVAAVAGLAGLGLWSLISSGWAQSAESATVEANRWLSYAALLLLATALTRGRRRASLLLVAVGVGIAVVAATVLARMLGGDPATLFVSGRLNSPLGYINGEGCVFAMGCWAALALAERRQPLLAGLGATGAVAMACLALLSQSRGAAIASFAALVVALVAIPGVRRRVLALAVIAGGVALAAGPVVRVYSTGQASVASPVAHHAAVSILAAAALTGAVWGALVALARTLERRDSRAQMLLSRCATGLAVLVLAVPILAAVVRASSIERTLRTQWHAFVHLSDTGGSSATAQTRLFSGAGNRYDYWRVAGHVFAAHPLAGVGAGNYSAFYYRERRTQESIENPHSLELQTASELGVAGLALLALVLAAIAFGARRLRAAARSSLEARGLIVAATGMFVVWLVDSSGDWMHLLPGVSAVALVAMAVLLHSPAPAKLGRPRSLPARRLPVLAGTAGVAFLLAVAGASLLRSGLVQRYLDSARAELRSHPAATIRDAARALRLDSANLDAYYLEAAGQARFDLAGPARSTLLAAARENPESFITWTLLGDLEVRLRDFGAARTFYGKAHALDPSDPALSRLAANPASALDRGH
jgi:UDP-GlcNAc:undecaprenyl-phosphate GlcNAc-1-phosphate transferase